MIQQEPYFNLLKTASDLDLTGISDGDVIQWSDAQQKFIVAPVGAASLDGKVDYVFDDDFYLDGQNQLSDIDILKGIIPYDAYIVAVGAFLAEQRTAGTIDFVVKKNNTPIGLTGLNIQINASYPLDRMATVAHRTAGYNFSANDVIQVAITTNTFAPIDNKGKIFVVIKNA